MKIFNKESGLEKRILIIYFGLASFDILAEMFYSNTMLFILKPLTLIVLMFLYWKTSKHRDSLFFLSLFFLIIVRCFVILNTEEMLFLGMFPFFVHQIIMIFYIKKLIQLKDYIPLLLAMVPFLFLFFYLLSLTSNITSRSYYGLIIQNILISVITGMALSNYVMNNQKKDLWLLVFGLLSVSLYFIVFIEKYYLLEFSPISFRPLAVLLTTAVSYIFYKFVIETETSNDN